MSKYLDGKAAQIRAYEGGRMTGLQVVATANKWLKEQANLNMVKYTDTGNKEYLGAQRAFAEACNYINGLATIPGKGQSDGH